MRTEHKSSERSISTPKMPRFDRLKIVELWRKQDGNYFCISTKDRDTGKWDDHFFETWKFDEIPEFLEDHEDTHDIYFCIHGFSRKKRTKEFAEPSKVLWADLDEVDPLDISRDFEPTISFQTSPGRYSALWVMDGYVTESLNQRLNYHLHADLNGWADTKVLRVVPGLRNYKYEDAPKVRYVMRDGPTHRVKRFDRILPTLEATPDDADITTKLIRYSYEVARKIAIACKMFGKWSQAVTADNARSSAIWYFGMSALEYGFSVSKAVAVCEHSKAFQQKYAGEPRRAEIERERLFEKFTRELAKLRKQGRVM